MADSYRIQVAKHHSEICDVILMELRTLAI